jgi:glucuronoarabinoxylan endo-1,4-beta-xylanase
MKKTFSIVGAALGTALLLASAGTARAQTATVTLSSQKQYIRGYGGMTHAAWAGDLNVAERTLAFGNASGQLGFSILRLPVTDGNPDSVNVATAKAAIAAGAIVLATPWNAASTYTSAQFPAYATHLNNFVSYMKNQGVDLYAISVQNEPDYGAQAGWGSWSAAACHDFIVNYGASITTKLMSCESFSYNKSYYDPILNDPAALANVDLFGTHLYGTPVNSYAYPLFDSKAGGKERWMTEHYTDSTTDANSWPNAMGVASEVHNAMVTGQFNAYIWWYIKRSYGFINNGAVTKRGDCIGHWSKFVRPGFYRVDATASPSAGLSLSAFKGDSSVVVVVVNTNSSAKSLSLSIPGSTIASFTKYTTSSSKSLANDGAVSASNGTLSVSFDASSVTTLVGSGGAGSGGAGSGGAGSGGAGSGGAGSGGAGSGGAGSGGKSGAGGSAAIGGTSSNGGAAPNGGAFSEGGSTEIAGSNSAGSGGSPTSAGGGAFAGAGNTFGTAGTTGAAGSTAPSAGAQGSIGESNPTDAGCTCRMASRESKPKSFALFSLLGVLGLAWGRRRNGRQTKPHRAG